MKLYCEVVVKDILPAVRSLITRELIEDFKMNQTDISKKLGVTQPAVSLYKKAMRGSKVKKLEGNREVMSIVRSLSREIATKTMSAEDVQMRFLEISHKIYDKKIVDFGYQNLNSRKEIPCNICFKS